MQQQTVIVAAKRTPIGAFQGDLSTLSAPRLGAVVINALLKETKIDKAEVDEVILGNVLSAGSGQAPARQAAIYGGLPNNVESITVNKMCGSGLKAVMLADQSIRLCDSEVVIAGGMESMSNAPYLLRNTRGGQRLGHGKMIDSIIHDGLWDAYTDKHMGNCAEMLCLDRNYNRESQDEFAINSYKRAQTALEDGVFRNEITPIEVPKKKGESVIIFEDEEPGKARFEKIPTLLPVFEKGGVITAANASKINDGAAVVLAMSNEKAKELGIKPLVKIIAHASVANEPEWFTTAPGKAIGKVLMKADLNKNDIDIWEINEAFAAVTMAAIDDFNIDPAKVNIYGGAIAIGHPIGASGARILTTLLNGLQRMRDSKYGLATLCIGGGEASAIIVEKV